LSMVSKMRLQLFSECFAVAMSALLGPTVTEVIGPTLGRFDD
jgi:hypothetical protein